VQYLRVYVGYLRNKLEDDPHNPTYLVSEWGVGYRLARLPIEARSASADPSTPRLGMQLTLA
jgi:two-component system KDP operon response regulator KdpE